ncbi:protein sorting system archaetidylserine synthase [Haloplanus sp. GCM10025708]|uniref:protein sorting system archaetidylserine synthase n=1 Tax=Haloferacaceae TaxID=1644056 RepID=UPI003605C722
MQPRFVGRLGPADAVTAGNAVLGFLAAFTATFDATLAARLLLLAAITDGLDGVVARKFGGTPVGPHLDSLADVASFGVAPALLVACHVTAMPAWSLDGGPVRFAVTLGLGGAFVATAVVRLGLYTVYDSEDDATEGAPTTLAATILSAGVLAGFVGPAILVGLSGALAVLMVSTVQYPDLHSQDALVMGVVQLFAIVFTGRPGEVFAFAILFLSLAYTTLAPRFYWGR